MRSRAKRFADSTTIVRMPLHAQAMALVAELEPGFISDRTRAALAAAKRRGKKLGGFRAGAKLAVKARKKGADANAKKDYLAPAIGVSTGPRTSASNFSFSPQKSGTPAADRTQSTIWFETAHCR
jgi:DNA invertase Pin-like site-specific DNA recombinase